MSINIANINYNDNLNNIQNNNLNNKNVELNFNPYPNLDKKQSYEKINTIRHSELHSLFLFINIKKIEQY